MESVKSSWSNVSFNLWTEVCDTVQETGIKNIPKEKKSKKAKWLSEEALQSYEKKRSKKQRRKKQNGKDYRSCLDLKKVEEPEVELSTSLGSSKKQESSRKISTSALLTMLKPLTV